MSPDELYFRGEQKIENVLLRVMDFDAENLEESAVDTIADVLKYKESPSVTWFNVDGLHNKTVMDEIAKGFDLDRLILAEVMNTEARPRIQEFSNALFLSVKMLQEDEKSHRITVENLSLIITPRVLISFQEKKGDVFDPVRERIRAQRKRIRSSGTDYLTFALLDIVVDNYIYIISVLGEKIEDIEEQLIIDPTKNIIDEINTYKRELNFLRKNINPCKEMILSLSKLDTEFIHKGSKVHYKELLDNINQAVEWSDSYREILSDQLNIYHTLISSRLNDIMKFLTVFSVIFIPLTFIAGIYGTNFDNIPELHLNEGYYIMWSVMVVVAIAMLIYFKRKKWL